MPSPIAHAVTGYCLGQVFPRSRGQLSQRGAIAVGVITAVAADLDFLPQVLWDATSHRGISHSLGVAVVFSLALAGLLRRWQPKGFRTATGLGMLAYGSHLLLDLLTKGGRGMPIFWPLSSMLVRSPVVIFPPVHHSKGLFYSGHLTFILFESVYALALLWLTHRGLTYWQRRRLTRLESHLSEPTADVKSIR